MSFTENQKATLLSYFNNGMVGVGRNFLAQITTASAETGLSEKQVKVSQPCSLYFYIYINYMALLYDCNYEY